MKLTAEEKIRILLDENTFNEIGKEIQPLSDDFNLIKGEKTKEGLITGYGTIGGQLVFMYLQDGAALKAQGLSMRQAKKIENIINLACHSGAPLIALLDSRGARINEGLELLNSYGQVYRAHLKGKEKIPQLIGVLGQAVGADALVPGLGDLVFAVEGSTQWHLNSPKDIQEITGGQVTGESIGGAHIHFQTTGQADFIFSSEADCLTAMRTVIGLLPQHKGVQQKIIAQQVNENLARATDDGGQLEKILAEGESAQYDMLRCLQLIFGQEKWLQLGAAYGPSMITGLAQIAGMTVGVIANQPMNSSGAIDVFGLRKATKLLKLCASFNLPVISFVNTAGFLPDSNQEYMGIIGEVNEYLKAYTAMENLKITVVTGKAIGTCFNLMGNKGTGADFVYAWPNAEIGVLNSAATNYLVNFNIIREAEEPGAKWQETLAATKDKINSPKAALSAGIVDSLIEPRETYFALYNMLNLLQYKPLS